MGSIQVRANAYVSSVNLHANSVPDSLFIFVDESGNFDFSHTGTRHFVMAGVAALAPIESAATIQALKYQLLAEGHDQSEFHATQDRQEVRNRVFSAISGLANIRSHVIFGDKHLAAPALQSDTSLHALFGRSLVSHVIGTYASADFRQVVVLFDQAFSKKKQGTFNAAVKPELKALGKPFHIYFHPMKTDSNGQIADYIAWAKFVQLERNEQRPWDELQSALKPSDFNIFRHGHTRYY